MRLIDADLFLENVRKELNCDERCCECVHDNLCEIYKMILKQPTAYDLGKVLHDLKEAKIPIIDLKMGVKINGIQQTDDAVLYERAVEIVKFGSAANE